MKLRAAYRYQIHDLKFSILIYYCVIVGLFILVAARSMYIFANETIKLSSKARQNCHVTPAPLSDLLGYLSEV